MNIACHAWFWIALYGLGFLWFYLGYAEPKLKSLLFPAAGVVNVVCNVVTSVMVFVLPVLISASEQARLPIPPLVSLPAGMLLIAVSLLLQILARRHIGVLPGGPYQGLRRDQELVTIGIYRHLRHPIYLAFILWQAGLAVLFAGAHALIFTLFYILALLPLIMMEERELHRRYGDEYSAYKKNTPMLLPI